MEDEEIEVRKLMFQKNLVLILDGHIKIDVEHFKAMQTEFKSVLRKELDADIVEKFKEFMQTVNGCLKALTRCPTKELLDNEVKDFITEECP